MNYCEPSFCYECKLEDNDLENEDWEIILETAPKQRQWNRELMAHWSL